MSAIAAVEEFSEFEIARDRDQFLRELLRELSGMLEDVVGVDDAAGFISVVGARIGERMNDEYCALAGTRPLSLDQIAAALIDLKRRIDGGFEIESIDNHRIVLINSRCPFGKYVKDRPSLCMMTSNVFGRIVAENAGYAEVAIPEAIARGDGRCRVVISLAPGMRECDTVETREYYAAG